MRGEGQGLGGHAGRLLRESSFGQVSLVVATLVRPGALQVTSLLELCWGVLVGGCLEVHTT